MTYTSEEYGILPNPGEEARLGKIAIVERNVAYAGWMTFSILSIRLADGRLVKRETVEQRRAACVLPYDVERRSALLVRQFRAPVCFDSGEESLLEAIAGMLDGDDSAATARREALEEAGLRLGPLEPVADAWSSPGISTERVSLFLAPYRSADRVAEGGGLADEHEEIEIVEMPLSDVAALADGGGLRDLKTLALVQTLRVRRPELFRRGTGS